MTKVLSVVPLAFAIAAAGCVMAPGTPEQRDAFDAWLYAPFANAELTTGPAIESLGTLRGKSAVPHVARHAEGHWSETTYDFDGLSIKAIVSDTPPYRALPIAISITSPAWHLSDGTTVGARVADVAFPVPASDRNAREYCGINNCIELYASGGRITRIEISLYAD